MTRVFLIAIAMLIALPASAYNYVESFDGWPTSPDACFWEDVWRGRGPDACNGTGMLVGLGERGRPDAAKVVTNGCRDGQCLQLNWNSNEQRYMMFPKMDVNNQSSLQGTLPQSDWNGGYFSYWLKLPSGFIRPPNSMKTGRIFTGGGDPFSALICYADVGGANGGRFVCGSGQNPTTSCAVDFNIFDHRGEWLHFEYYVDRAARTVKVWVTSESGKTRSCSRTDMRFADNQKWKDFHLLGNLSANGIHPVGGIVLVDDMCLAESESARASGGFCESGQAPPPPPPPPPAKPDGVSLTATWGAGDELVRFIHDPAEAGAFEVEVEGLGIVAHERVESGDYGAMRWYALRPLGEMPGSYRVRVRVVDAGASSDWSPWSEPRGVVPRADYDGDGRVSLSDLNSFIRAMWAD